MKTSIRWHLRLIAFAFGWIFATASPASAQIAADAVGVDLEKVRLVLSDTDVTPYGGGTWASRGLSVGGEAALMASGELRARILAAGAALLEFGDGQAAAVAQLHSIKRRVLPSGNVSYDAERTNRGHADLFWAITLACQRERGPNRSTEAEVGVRVLG